MANIIRCYVCDARTNRRQAIHIYRDDRIEQRVIAINRRNEQDRVPQAVGPETCVCFNCYQNILQEIRNIAANPMSVRLNVLRQTQNGSCFLCNAVNNVHRLSTACKVKAFLECGIFIREYVRSCNQHLDSSGFILKIFLPNLVITNKKCVIKGPYLEAFLNCIPKVSRNERRYQDVNDLSREEVHTVTSLTHEQFEDLYTYCDRVHCAGGYRNVNKKDLLLCLCKLRQGLSDEFLKVLFNYSSWQDVSLAVTKVRESLAACFVPENIGFAAITRQNYIEQHVTEFANMLYNPEPNRPAAIVYIDGTYAYCYKSKNFRALRQSFCRHKGRRLHKPALLVAPDGYILDIHGPYFSDAFNNDASMLQNEFENNEEINDWIQEGDIVIVDRGYRDAVEMLQDFGIIVKIPPNIAPGKRQFSTEEANKTRTITKTRWVVESRNGHFRTMFKFLESTQQIQVLPHIGQFYRISRAIINRYTQTNKTVCYQFF